MITSHIVRAFFSHGSSTNVGFPWKNSLICLHLKYWLWRVTRLNSFQGFTPFKSLISHHPRCQRKSSPSFLHLSFSLHRSLLSPRWGCCADIRIHQSLSCGRCVYPCLRSAWRHSESVWHHFRWLAIWINLNHHLLLEHLFTEKVNSYFLMITPVI